MSVVLLVILLLLTIFFPIISVVFNLIGFILFKRERKFIAFLLALSIASVAYVWNPSYEADLYRWHVEMQMFKDFTFGNLLKYVSENFEPLNYFIKFLLSKTGDFNLLQFFVSGIGYLEMFLIFADFSKRENIKLSSFVISLFFIISTLQFIGFISGLWFYFAVINFFVGIYLEFVVKTKKIHWFFYISSICLHISMLLILIILIFVKRSTKQICLWKIFAIFIVTFLVDKIIIWLNNFDVSIFKYIYQMYDSYFLNGSQFDSINGGSNLLFGIYRLIICLITFFLNKKIILEKFNYKYYNLLVIIMSSVMALLFSANVFVRFIFYIQLLILPILLLYLNENTKKNKIPYYFLIFISICLMSIKQYNSLVSSNIFNDINNNILNSIFMLGER